MHNHKGSIEYIAYDDGDSMNAATAQRIRDGESLIQQGTSEDHSRVSILNTSRNGRFIPVTDIK
ncbi:hypothetical protein FH966_11865 [Lentibacillus cibarius]|uniref:Uncharacterized protein n=1 Tax=Lentibacillus cibarius TaxID=2583219 RepID=A0A549YKD4_9BACI|nr:hypothetical protein FH966_11865 [Lentibacillus cibarius]